jgi:hypothetical protein
MLALLCLAVAGCSFSIPPLTSFSSDDTTGSIKTESWPLAPDLDEKDWRLAEPALHKALVSDEPSAPASWSNPNSGRSGAFLPVAGTFLRDGKSCRAFVARIASSETAKMVQAIGCPLEGDRVAVGKASPWKGI